MDYKKYMALALEQAKIAYKNGDVPIGCVIVYNDKVIASAYNCRMKNKNVLHHSEIIAIDKACKNIGDWRLEDCTLFVTVEPCPMCAGAILQARFKEVVFGAKNEKAGCVGSIYNILQDDRFNHIVSVKEGVLEDECSFLMKSFFKDCRKRDINTDLAKIPGVSKGIIKHFNSIGIYEIKDLVGKDAKKLYELECEKSGKKIEKTMLYIYKMAIYFAENSNVEKEKLNIKYWKNKV